MPLRTCFQEALWEELGHGKNLDWGLGVWASLTHSWPTTSVGSAPSFRDLATPKPETLGIKTNKQKKQLWVIPKTQTSWSSQTQKLA